MENIITQNTHFWPNIGPLYILFYLGCIAPSLWELNCSCPDELCLPSPVSFETGMDSIQTKMSFPSAFWMMTYQLFSCFFISIYQAANQRSKHFPTHLTTPPSPRMKLSTSTSLRITSFLSSTNKILPAQTNRTLIGPCVRSILCFNYGLLLHCEGPCRPLSMLMTMIYHRGPVDRARDRSQDSLFLALLLQHLTLSVPQFLPHPSVEWGDPHTTAV